MQDVESINNVYEGIEAGRRAENVPSVPELKALAWVAGTLDGHRAVLGGETDRVVGAVHLHRAAGARKVGPGVAAERGLAGDRRAAAGFEPYAGAETIGQVNGERSVEGTRFERGSVPRLACEMDGDRAIFGVQVDIAAIAVEGDWAVLRVHLDYAAAIVHGDRAVGRAQPDGTVDALHLDRSVLRFEIQGRVFRRVHEEHHGPFALIGGRTVERNRPGGVVHGNTAGDLVGHGAIVGDRDAAGLDRVVGMIPSVDMNLSTVGRVDFENRRFTLGKRERAVELGEFGGGSGMEVGAAGGIALGGDIEVAALGGVTGAGRKEPSQAKRGGCGVNQAFVPHAASWS